MLKKCANPQCTASFMHLGQGRLFRVQRKGPKLADSNLDATNERPAVLEHFWLCDKCAGTMTVAVDRKQIVRVIPMRTQHAAAS
ncbi:MAG TPA: hypothetical protein VMT82_00130 [candidate division Zixibacteria bacterium]|nr:hypothetical protein [candidate division Zixibacteria bacterium]